MRLRMQRSRTRHSKRRLHAIAGILYLFLRAGSELKLKPFEQKKSTTQISTKQNVSGVAAATHEQAGHYFLSIEFDGNILNDFRFFGCLCQNLAAAR